MRKKKKVGKRFNQSKLRYRNFPLWLSNPAVEVGHFGESKYDSYNFLSGLYVADCLESAYRHLEKVDNPNESDFDEESKCHHLAHLAWNALVALYMIKNHPELDNRYKVLKKKKPRKK